VGTSQIMTSSCRSTHASKLDPGRRPHRGQPRADKGPDPRRAGVVIIQIGEQVQRGGHCNTWPFVSRRVRITRNAIAAPAATDQKNASATPAPDSDWMTSGAVPPNRATVRLYQAVPRQNSVVAPDLGLEPGAWSGMIVARVSSAAVSGRGPSVWTAGGADPQRRGGLWGSTIPVTQGLPTALRGPCRCGQPVNTGRRGRQCRQT
jgi:hypothetical protein